MNLIECECKWKKKLNRRRKRPVDVKKSLLVEPKNEKLNSPSKPESERQSLLKQPG